MALETAAAGATAAIVAALLARHPEGFTTPVGDRAALYARVHRVLLPVCREGPWDALRDILRCARHEALGEHTPPPVRHAALELLAAMERPEVGEELVRAAVRLGFLVPDLEALLAAAGPAALRAIGGVIRNLRGTPLGEEFQVLARRLGPGPWRSLLDQLLRDPAEDVAPFLPLIAGLPLPLAREAGERLVRHPAPEIRRRALAFLLALRPRDAAWRGRVEAVLRDPDRQVADLGRAVLLEGEDVDPALLELALAPDVPAPAEGTIRQRLLALRDRLATGEEGDERD